MFNAADAIFISICLEGFLFGIYSGIFVLYFQCQSDKSRTTTRVFYAVCLLYVLSTVSFTSDLVALILRHRLIVSLEIVEAIASGCCDFLAQCILIYRCWIVWGRDIRVVIFPSFLAIAYLATWVMPKYQATTWFPLNITSFVLTMAVNGLVTGLIAFRILKVFSNIKAATTSVERTLGSTRGSKFRHVIFIIIESGMTLFAIQLVRTVLFGVPSVPSNSLVFLIIINEMFNGITPTIILVRVSMKLSFDDEESFKEAIGSLVFNNPPSDRNTLQRMGGVLPQESERNEDNYLHYPSGDPDTLQRAGSSSIPPQPPHCRRGLRIFVLISQVIRIHFSEWEVVVVVYSPTGRR